MDQAQKGQLQGRFYHAYTKEAEVFSTIEEAIFGLERFYDSLNFPHPTTDNRTFIKEERHTKFRQERTRIMKDEELLNRHGDLGTFIVRVQHRQNSSWQGRITWMDQNKTVYFRSIWEMIKLVEEALNMVSEQEDSPGERFWQDEE
ncbi:MAG: hypothetical protein HFH94_06325 [Lachnospiraceae bacterium]|nr:hypothetical protein [Lachnospiraceae bacterium]